MRPLLSLVAILLACMLCSSVSAQDCANGQCSMRARPTFAPPLPNIQAALHSVVDAQPVRRVASAVVRLPVQSVRSVQYASPVQRAARGGILRRLFRGCR